MEKEKMPSSSSSASQPGQTVKDAAKVSIKMAGGVALAVVGCAIEAGVEELRFGGALVKAAGRLKDVCAKKNGMDELAMNIDQKLQNKIAIMQGFATTHHSWGGALAFQEYAFIIFEIVATAQKWVSKSKFKKIYSASKYGKLCDELFDRLEKCQSEVAVAATIQCAKDNTKHFSELAKQIKHDKTEEAAAINRLQTEMQILVEATGDSASRDDGLAKLIVGLGKQMACSIDEVLCEIYESRAEIKLQTDEQFGAIFQKVMEEHNIASVAELEKLSSKLAAVQEQLETINLKLDKGTQRTLQTIVDGNEGSAIRDTQITELLENLATQHSCSATKIMGEFYKIREEISATLKTDDEFAAIFQKAMAEHNIASVAQLDNLPSEVGAVKEQLDTINLKLDNDTQNTKKNTWFGTCTPWTYARTAGRHQSQAQKYCEWKRR
jgi:hypothetical protein